MLDVEQSVCMSWSRGVRCDFTVACSCANVEWWNWDRRIGTGACVEYCRLGRFRRVVVEVSVSRSEWQGGV